MQKLNEVWTKYWEAETPRLDDWLSYTFIGVVIGFMVGYLLDFILM